MPEFKFTAADAAGRTQTGVVRAESQIAARQHLAALGWTSIDIEPARPPAAVASSTSLAGGDMAGDLAQTLASATAMGAPLTAGLQALAVESRSPQLRSALIELSRRVEAGRPLDEALADISEQIPPSLAGVIRAGLRSGRLPAALSRYVDLSREAGEARRSLWLGMAYPIILLALSFVVVAAIALLLVPAFREMYEDFNMSLPTLTVAVLSISAAFENYGVGIVIGLALLAGAIWLILRIAVPAEVRSQLLDLTPMVGPARQQFALARFCRLLSLLVSGQTPLPEALRLAGSATNPGLSAGAERLAQHIEVGWPPEDAVLRVPQFPRALAPILRWHDRGTAFTEGLDAAADLFVARSLAQTTLLSLVVEPAVIVSVALMLGLNVIALFFPLVFLLNELS